MITPLRRSRSRLPDRLPLARFTSRRSWHVHVSQCSPSWPVVRRPDGAIHNLIECGDLLSPCKQLSSGSELVAAAIREHAQQLRLPLSNARVLTKLEYAKACEDSGVAVSVRVPVAVSMRVHRGHGGLDIGGVHTWRRPRGGMLRVDAGHMRQVGYAQTSDTQRTYAHEARR